MKESELEIAACLLRTKCKILNKQTTNLRKSVEKLYQELHEVLRGEDGKYRGQSETDSELLAGF